MVQHIRYRPASAGKPTLPVLPGILGGPAPPPRPQRLLQAPGGLSPSPSPARSGAGGEDEEGGAVCVAPPPAAGAAEGLPFAQQRRLLRAAQRGLQERRWEENHLGARGGAGAPTSASSIRLCTTPGAGNPSDSARLRKTAGDCVRLRATLDDFGRLRTTLHSTVLIPGESVFRCYALAIVVNDSVCVVECCKITHN
eukprot:gene16401-biopygen18791